MSDMYTTMTRVWFCPTCFSRRLPKTHHKFLVFGATHGFKFKKAKGNGTPGYTPHILEFVSLQGENVVFDYYCALHGCGVHLEYVEGFQHHTVINRQRSMIPLKEWNNWFLYKHDPDYEL